MGALALDRSPRLERRLAAGTRDLGTDRRATDSDGGAQAPDCAPPTLERMIEEVWAQLEEHGAERCPVCHGTMLRALGARGGTCTGCRATLG